VPELGAALASLGIIYSDEDIEAIHLQLEENFGAVNYVRRVCGAMCCADLLLPRSRRSSPFW
jgi:hypothetical protein